MSEPMGPAPDEQIFDEGVVPQHLHKWELDGPDYEGMDHARCTFSWLIPPGLRGKKPRTRVCGEYKDIDQIETALNEREALMVIGGPLSKEKWAWALRNCGSAAKALLGFAVLALYAITAGAQPHRPADQLYILSAGHLVVGSTTYVTEIHLFNPNDEPVSVHVQFKRANSSGSDPNGGDIHIAPHSPYELADDELTRMIGSGMGMLVLSGCVDGRPCGQMVDLTSNPKYPRFYDPQSWFRAISATARVYSFPTGSPASGTRGAEVPVTAWYNMPSSDAANVGRDRVSIVNIREDARWHTNVTLANGSQFSWTWLIVNLFDGMNVQHGGAYVEHLGPLESVQRSLVSMFPALAQQNRLNRGPAIPTPWLSVTQSGSVPTEAAKFAIGCENGCPVFGAQASVTDSLSGDFYVVDGEFEPPAPMMVPGGDVHSPINQSSEVAAAWTDTPKRLASEATVASAKVRTASAVMSKRESSGDGTVIRPATSEVSSAPCSVVGPSRDKDDYVIYEPVPGSTTGEKRVKMHVRADELDKARAMCGGGR